jgi:hypothetical protein
LVYSLSWTAYPRLAFSLGVRILLFMAAYTLAIWIFKIKHTDPLANAGVYIMLGLALVWTFYDVVYLLTTKLYVDRRGVWLAQGVFPWSKGIYGAVWDQIGEATYTLSFFSWAFKSYGLSLRHRFTGNEELYLKHVRNGHIAAQSINRMLMAKADPDAYIANLARTEGT